MKKQILKYCFFCSFVLVPLHVLSQVTFSDAIVIQETLTDGAVSVYAADLDGDEDLDVLSASSRDDKIAWYENTNGQGGFGPQRVITTSADQAQSVYAADLDGDGDLDVLSASYRDNKIAWYENTDGQGGFGPQQLITTLAEGALSVYAFDMDGDGDFDVLSGSSYTGYDQINWYENTDGQGSFGEPQGLTNPVNDLESVYAADLDGDGDIDVLSAYSWDGWIVWYENTDGQGSFGPPQVITTLADGVRSVYAVDLDGDGDTDVLSASFDDDKIAWYRNTDGQGSFGSQQLITTSADEARSVYAADLDDDGDFDVLSASSRDNRIAWYENIDTEGNFGPQQLITTSASGARCVYAADLDGDGDTDVLSASYDDDKIAWHENLFIDTFVDYPLIEAPVNFNLRQNYPNPFNPETTIVFDVPRAGRVTITIYNILGQGVKTLVDEAFDAGTHTVVWDGSDRFGNRLPSGVYLYRMEAEDFVKVREVLLLR